MPLDRAIFTVTGRTRAWSARDILDWAEFAGRLEPAWQRLLQGVAAGEAAAAAGRVADETAVQAILEEFRYDRDLITVEETERWLEAREITVESLVEHLERCLWLRESTQPGASNASFAGATTEIKELLCMEAILTGDMEQFARGCGRRVVAWLRGDQASSVEVHALQRTQFLERHGLADGNVDDWLAALGRDAGWLDEQLRMETAYQQVCAAWLTDENRQSFVRAQRLSLLEIQLEQMTFASLDAAREACLCVREEGRSVAQFADECGQPYGTSRFLLGSLPPDQQARLLSLTPGETVGPEPVADGFQFCRLVAKAEPTLTNPEVAAAVDERILEARFNELSADLLHWELPESRPA